MIPLNFITEWTSVVPWTSQNQIEQDLIISRAIVEIFNNYNLREKLAFRGGTALNKHHLSHPHRYSEDLDFIQIASEPVGSTLDELRSVLDPWLGVPKRAINEAMVKLIYRFTSNQGTPLKLKIEINTREHFLAQHITHVSYEVKSRWFESKALVTTLSFSALMGSKLRALYQRKKGRDLFDLVLVLLEGKVAPEDIVSSFLEHISQEGLSITRAEFEENLALKMRSQIFLSDLKPLLATDSQFDVREAFTVIMKDIMPLLPGEKWKLLDKLVSD